MPETAAATEPLERVFKSEEVTPVIAKDVVVAFVPVALAKMKLPVRVVEAEERPPLKAMRVVVALLGKRYAKF